MADGQVVVKNRARLVVKRRWRFPLAIGISHFLVFALPLALVLVSRTDAEVEMPEESGKSQRVGDRRTLSVRKEFGNGNECVVWLLVCHGFCPIECLPD